MRTNRRRHSRTRGGRHRRRSRACCGAGTRSAGRHTRHALVCSEESTPPARFHRERIVEASSDDTLYTDVFDVMDDISWPEGISGRTVATPFARSWHGRADELRGERAAILASSDRPGEPPLEAHSAYAGQSAGLVGDVRPAGDIVRSIVNEAEREIERLGKLRR